MSSAKRTAGPGPGQTRIQDIAPTTWVLVPSPGGVPANTPVAVDGDPVVMQTGIPRPLSIGCHSFRVTVDNAIWEASAQLDRGGTEARPTRVTLARTGTGQLSILQPKTGQGSVIAATGRPADIRTIVYIHGIGNKPIASVLRCQWDTALFGHGMGDRSRMAYWADRDRYPRPLGGSCADFDLVTTEDDKASTATILAIGPESSQLVGATREEAAIERTIVNLSPDEHRQETLRSIATEAIAAADARAAAAPSNGPGTTGARIFPFGEDSRRTLTRLLTRALLPDVHDFLFDASRRKNMTESLAERLRGGGEPFVVIAHSQGSMIAYDVLRRLNQQDCDVALFITIGSPLGLQEVKDDAARFGPLTVPECVARWCNIAELFDPVAFDPILADDYAPSARNVAVEDFQVHNLDSPLHPHSGTGYLATDTVRGIVSDTAGLAFVQRLSEVVINRDVAARAENAPRNTLQDVLIQLSDSDDSGTQRPLADLALELVAGLRQIVTKNGRVIDPPEILRRFVVAKLTTPELDGLRTLSEQLHVKQVWANSVKRALINDTASTIQALPARLGYGATGVGINWAVLDTGIDQEHRHFQTYQNVRAQWDCTVAGPPQRLQPGPATPAGLDPHGHGTHVAGIIGGGLDAVHLGDKQLPFYGMAPQVGLYGFRVLGKDGAGNDAWIIKALDMIAGMNEQSSGLVIHGVNLSLGSNYDPSIYGCGHTPLCEELRRLWRQGVLVCLAAGNEGFAELTSLNGVVNANMSISIGDPANLDEAIAVGSVHKLKPHSYGVSYFSSRGPTADGRRKPDLVAPGEKVLSALAGGRSPQGAPPDASTLYVEMSGTSMAAPHVSGLLAAFLSVRREFIGNPKGVKDALLDACTDLKRDSNMQGAGLPNLVRMVLET